MVRASYTCAAPAGTIITSCRGPVAAGALIDTRKAGLHSFTVKAGDRDGINAAQTVTYTVTPERAKPSITAIKQTATRWREGSKPAHITGRHSAPPVGTTFSFSLDQSAALTMCFTRLVRVRFARVGDGRVTGWWAGERARGPGRRPDNATLGSRPEPRVTLAPLVGVIVTFARAAAPSVTFPESREPRAESRSREPRPGAGSAASGKRAPGRA